MAEADFMARLCEAVARRPFEPFELELPDGRRVTVDRPEAIAFRAGVAVYLGQDRTCTLFNHRQMRQVALASDHPPRRQARPWTAGLLAGFLLGICGAVIAATVEIESIVGSGPIFSGIGLWVAEHGRRRGLRGMFWLGMSTLMLTLLVFAVINLAEWGPADARRPVSVMLMIYQSLAVSAGLIMLWRLFDDAREASPVPWQFNLRSLLGLICLIAVSLGAARVSFDLGLATLTATATAMTAATCGALAALGLVLYLRSKSIVSIHPGV
jgi:hypothetical protein